MPHQPAKIVARRQPVDAPKLPPFRATNPEALVLWRRRLNVGQKEAAQLLGVSTDMVRRWEADEAEHCPRSRIAKVRDYEICFIFRRRAGLTQAELAGEAECTRMWLMAMEAGEVPIDRLRTFWAFRLANTPSAL